VFLVGFMGAGKSSIGRALGQRLNWLFEDLDDRIEQREGRRIAEIFRAFGEAAFRQMEHEALRQSLEELRGVSKIVTSKIIALGGGAFAQKANVALLQASGVPTVFLNAPVEELWRRCCQQAVETSADRPLLRDIDEFRRLHRSRHKSYSKASLKIETAGRTVDEIAAEIAETLGLKSIALRTEPLRAE
jgi:shikimate kinase